MGSGCGAAGGGPTPYANGGHAPAGVEQGMDGKELPSVGTTTWTPGSVQVVGFGISANHAGGYQYRLCKKDGNVTEECFQSGSLRFAGSTSWIQWSNGTKSAEFPITKTTEGTFPAGSEWARIPVPSCDEGDCYQQCGAALPPDDSPSGGKWDKQVNCYAACCGSSTSKALGYCPNKTQFPESVPHISGFAKYGWLWSVMDRVQVPADLELGEYLLSWRWDCEESTQVWENCADLIISDKPAPPSPTPTPSPPSPSPGPSKTCKAFENPTCSSVSNGCAFGGCKRCHDNTTFSCDECCDGCELTSKGDIKYCTEKSVAV